MNFEPKPRPALIKLKKDPDDDVEETGDELSARDQR